MISLRTRGTIARNGVNRMKSLYTAILSLSLLVSVPAWAGTYHLDIAREMVNITGTPVSKITVNGGIPGPTLRFTEGEDVTINVTNHLDEDTSVHWHGFL